MTGSIIKAARRAAEVADVRALFLEYADSLDFDLCFQGFDDEIADFPGRYGPPAGELLLAEADGAAAGAVGARPLDDGRLAMRPKTALVLRTGAFRTISRAAARMAS